MRRFPAAVGSRALYKRSRFCRHSFRTSPTDAYLPATHEICRRTLNFAAGPTSWTIVAFQGSLLSFWISRLSRSSGLVMRFHRPVLGVTHSLCFLNEFSGNDLRTPYIETVLELKLVDLLYRFCYLSGALRVQNYCTSIMYFDIFTYT